MLVEYVKIAHPKHIEIEKILRVLHSGYEISNSSEFPPKRSEIVSVTDTLKEHIFFSHWISGYTKKLELHLSHIRNSLEKGSKN